ncbi:MAG: 4Fe-4S binding protein [Angelakisella sp.]
MAVKKLAVVCQKECVACGFCVKVCPKKAIAVYKGLYAEVDPMLCVGCGKCERACPASVIRMEVAK